MKPMENETKNKGGRPDEYSEMREQARKINREQPSLSPSEICALVGLPINKIRRVYEWLK